MTFLVLGSGADIQLLKQLRDEGNKVYYWLPQKFWSEWDELFKEWEVNWIKESELRIPHDVDIVVYTFVGARELADKVSKNYPFFGADSRMQELELNRELGKKVMQKLGIKIPRRFSSNIDVAIETIKRNKKPMVVKPYNNLPVYTTAVPFTYEDSIVILEKIKKHFPNATVLCEEKINGVEVGIETFFDGEDFLYPINVSFEHKPAYELDQGPLTGETGTLMFYENSPLFYETLNRAKELFRRLNYHGDICIGLIVDMETKIPYGLEWTCRMGYPEILIQINALKIELGQLIYNTVFPQPQKEMPVDDIFLTGVALMGGGSPFEMTYKQYGRGFMIHGLDELEDGIPVISRTMIASASYKNGKFFTGEYDDRPLVIIGKGYTAYESIIDAYRFMRHVKCMNAFYRTDIGVKYVTHDSKFLYECAYINRDHFVRSYLPEFDPRLTLLKTKIMEIKKEGGLKEWLIGNALFRS
ncbi:MAG: hypothetical protein QW228_01165 [Candidatus Aenigmatarchaeota archaeon]